MEESLRRELAHVCQELGARGWVANHDGNVSVRLAEDRFLASPTAVAKRSVTPEMCVVVDGQGKVVHGERKVFSEIALHLACYRARPDVRWVVHSHAPHATGWAVAGESFFDPPFMGEPVVSLGDRIPLVPWGGDLALAVAGVDAVLLQSHGVLTVGKDAETALLRMELVEHLARIALVARQLGGPVPLPSSEVDRLLEARAKAGLGPQNVPPQGPAPESRPDVEAMVREALKRLG
ncbi:MAG: class II aldolase/adducin family protein [Myxococcota bacterium]